MGFLEQECSQTSNKTGGHIPINLYIGGVWTSYYIDPADLLQDNNTILLTGKGNYTQAIQANSFIKNIYLKAVSGTPIVYIGISPGSNDVLESQTVTFQPINTDQYFANAGNLYFTVTGGTINIRIELIPNFV
jgi:hypothetical protein